MIYRAEPGTLMVFNADDGITAAVSGKELYSLKKYLETEAQNEFINRLIDLKLMPEEISECERQELLKEIEKTENISAPVRSFAVPESIHIDITTFCPLKCPQCYKDLSQDIEMPLGKFFDIIERAKALKVFQIALGGGEPLTVKDLPVFVKKVTSCKMSCTITTSGYGLTAELLDDLKESGVNHIQVSLNGSTREINSYSRDGFSEAVSALNILSKSSVQFGINWVARRDNVKDFENIVTYAKELKADNINILRYKPSVREDYGKNVLTANRIFPFHIPKGKRVLQTSMNVRMENINMMKQRKSVKFLNHFLLIPFLLTQIVFIRISFFTRCVTICIVYLKHGPVPRTGYTII